MTNEDLPTLWDDMRGLHAAGVGELACLKILRRVDIPALGCDTVAQLQTAFRAAISFNGVANMPPKTQVVLDAIPDLIADPRHEGLRKALLHAANSTLIARKIAAMPEAAPWETDCYAWLQEPAWLEECARRQAEELSIRKAADERLHEKMTRQLENLIAGKWGDIRPW